MAFRVGQKVVCVDASPASDGCQVGLKHNGIYTVSGFCDWQFGDNPHLGLKVDQASPIMRSGFMCCCYNPMRFRPIVERKTDISIFTAMLKPSRENVRT